MSRFDDVCEDLVNRPRRWLVTGVAGFIGSALLEKLLDLGQSVVGVDNFLTGHRHNLDDVLAIHPDEKLQFRFIEGDLRDLEVARAACADVDIILHEAALGSVPRSIKDPLSSHQHNVDAFVNLLVAARDGGIKRMVYASSSSVYGDHPGLPKVEDRIGKPLSPYAVTKRTDEIYAQAFHDLYQMELIGLRYFNVFGRRQDPAGAYAAVIPRWIAALLDGKPCTIFGDGSNSRDFCYVDNVVQANLLAGATAERDATGTVYNVGCNGRTDLRELFTMIRDELAEAHPALAKVHAHHEAPREGDIAHSQASIEKIGKALGYVPTHDIAAGMAETVSWFAQRHGRRKG
ncbi:MAG: SDR family oxidoreductase [Kofleriaceae bacterium]|nr:SDR family oxidoreductase [Kofleriaceae bacterium]MBP6839495.1 SDR family oxidoreductase [Kofleriaceae bacterium]MBP9204857.1 SDR family oxidoreductase [Kofleriaceae bacterium]